MCKTETYSSATSSVLQDGAYKERTEMIGADNRDVLILCGGKGSRLESVVNDRPKPMAEINGRPFLQILIDTITCYGFRRFILCTGFKADFIRNHYDGRESGFSVTISREEQPLGTGGAIKHAEPFIRSDTFLATNGDSLCPLDLNEFLEFHYSKGALLSMALIPSDDESDCGVVRITDSHQIESFNEKAEAGSSAFINAGIYLFEKRILDYIPENKPYSLEYDLFPQLVNDGAYGFVSTGTLTDIGTPERLKMAQCRLREEVHSVRGER